MNTFDRLYPCILILFLWITPTVNAQDEKRKQLFLECWRKHIEDYITKNEIKLDPTTNKNPKLQWKEKFDLFEERLKKVKPIYEKWKQYKNRKNNINFENTTWTHGGGFWLLVFIGLKPRFEYCIGIDNLEIEFVKQTLNSNDIFWAKKYKMTDEIRKFPKIKTFLDEHRSINDNSFNIKVKKRFFKKKFILNYMNNKEDIDFPSALYYGLTPDIFHSVGTFASAVDTEEKKIKSKEFTIGNEKLSNNCSLLIPGVAIISYQTPYTILYGRLIQYALVYLENLAYYKSVLLKKLHHHAMYEDSWLSQRYPYFYQDPLIYDEIYKKYKKIREETGLTEDEKLKLPNTELIKIYKRYKKPEKIIPKIPQTIKLITSTQKQTIFSRIKSWWNRFFGC